MLIYKNNIIIIILIFITLFFIIKIIRLYKIQNKKLKNQIIIKKMLIERYYNKNSENIQTKLQLIRYKNININLKEKIEQLKTICNKYTEKIENFKNYKLDNDNLNSKIIEQSQIINNLKIEIKIIKNKFYDTKNFFQQKEKLMIKYHDNINIKLKKLANTVIESNTNHVTNLNDDNIIKIIQPLQKQIESLQNNLQNNLNQESIERNILQYELKNLKKLNMHLSREANNLTQALKGNNKLQGNWGELVLTKILESSGLRQGHEYDIQKKIFLQDKTLQPDIIIKLPNNKNIIIDAKVTLVSYERYFNSDNDNILRTQFLKEYITSVKKHLRLLNSKNYHTLYNIISLDYIIMFIPIETAFLLAINHKPSLLYEALKYNIMLVSPTTLMIALRTINNLWNIDKQNKHSLLLANKATKIYNKIKIFVDDICTLEKSLNKLQNNYNLIIKKLLYGKGNIITQVESFKDLGIDVLNKIDTNFLKNK
ncbi:DNA recombination protein RmuC [Enterobacteriaceae endosymbiont of Neohaemonia nigricornis]|uniref:DNA recombination protein RmuC n=1 Tax=Enterobacteriaceae endosymbiont of Neohaemonia nigricornis TaxID=2675792 RepID=UPI00144A025B|nr:DNA recombination protein RmuC [Enterobacteriaceae endosymbiont of Neohaemonia nigricornis]QJC30477.1 DNA recombination protein RmuC [Enterobacteriaceae endosymbiont of Neohaemonia nigricornis]